MIAYLSGITRQVIQWSGLRHSMRLSCVGRAVALGLVIGITVGITLNRDHLEALAALGYGGAFMVMLLSNATLVLPTPGLIFVFALGSSLHPLLLGVTAGLGAVLGELTGYLTGYSGAIAIEETRLAHRVNGWMTRNGTLTILLLSIVPNPVFDLAGVLAGATRMPVWRFLGVGFVGKTIQSSLIALAGSLSLSWVQDWLAH
jgi:uncharacterized membrane protein YdjX (TVP38/TMEM64 family)